MFFVVLVAGLVPLAGTPRSAIMNGVLCLLNQRISCLVRQSVLLSQNGSHPQIRPHL